MVFGLFGRRRSGARRLYAHLVELSRAPALYADAGVPDRIEGRLEMLFLHGGLAIRHFAQAGEAATAQQLTDLFFEDIERVLREFSIGDSGLEKRLGDVGRALFGRAEAYGIALDAGDRAALAEALGRNLTGREGKCDVTGLARHVISLHRVLSTTTCADILRDPTILPVFVRSGAEGATQPPAS